MISYLLIHLSYLLQGMSNAFGSFFSCGPVAASMSRSLVQEAANGVTQLTTAFSCAFLLLVLSVIGPYCRSLPNVSEENYSLVRLIFTLRHKVLVLSTTCFSLQKCLNSDKSCHNLSIFLAQSIPVFLDGSSVLPSCLLSSACCLRSFWCPSRVFSCK